MKTNIAHIPFFVPHNLIFLKKLGDYENARKQFVARQPMGRFGEAEEVANLALYLASDASAFTTGQFHIIDGGICM